jgi:hypothetical protein
MIGSDDVIKVDVRRRKPLFNPLGIRAVDKAFGTVTHRTGFPAGIAPDAPAGLFLEISPSFFRRHLFKLFHVGMDFDKGRFLYRISHQHICLDRVPMNAHLTGWVEKVLSLQSLLEIVTLYGDFVPLLAHAENLSFECLHHLSPVHHPLAGYPDQKQLIRLEPLFVGQGDNGASVTSFHDETYLKRTELMKVSRQVVLAEGVPDQAVRFFRGSDKNRSRTKGKGPFTETDDDVHLLA